VEYARGLGAADVIDYRTSAFTDGVRSIDAVIDAVGGATRERAVTS
jgi:NADPH:quinone reductase-like Zn-dependent oxidoreductase